MGISKHLSRVLRSKVSACPLMLHGTSIEAISYLVENGVLPHSDDPRIYRDFYFTPVSDNFGISPYHVPVRGHNTKKEAIKSARFYAGENARVHHLQKRIGYLPEWWYDAVDTPKNIKIFFMEDEGMSEIQASELVSILWRRKGLIIEPNERAFRFDYGPGDDPTTVAIACPEGFPKDCIGRVVPLGDVERNFLRKLVNSR